MTISFHNCNVLALAMAAAVTLAGVSASAPALAKSAKPEIPGLTPLELQKYCGTVGLEASAWLPDHTVTPAFDASNDVVRAFCARFGFHSRAAVSFKAADANHDGKLDGREFMALSIPVRAAAVDLDGDGYLTLAELTPWTSKSTQIAAAPAAPAKAEPDAPTKLVEAASRTPEM